MKHDQENPQKGQHFCGDFLGDPVGTLGRLEDKAYNQFGTDHRPPGKQWGYMVLDLARRILDEDNLINTISDADLDQLTEGNFHTARLAAEIALRINKYI